MIDEVVCYAKNLFLYTEHIDDLKKCKDDISRLEKEVAALNAVQRIFEGAFEMKLKGGN